MYIKMLARRLEYLKSNVWFKMMVPIILYCFNDFSNNRANFVNCSYSWTKGLNTSRNFQTNINVSNQFDIVFSYTFVMGY